jgi:hypothetical protein
MQQVCSSLLSLSIFRFIPSARLSLTLAAARFEYPHTADSWATSTQQDLISSSESTSKAQLQQLDEAKKTKTADKNNLAQDLTPPYAVALLYC